MNEIINGLRFTPWAIPVFFASVSVAAMSSAWLARQLESSRLAAFGLVASLGGALGVTVTPALSERWWQPVHYCTRSVGSLPNFAVLDERSLNVYLFVPLGFCCMLPASRRLAVLLVGGALVLPFGIEATQRLLPVLGRACQMQDVVQNDAGVIAGVVVAILVRMLREPGGTPLPARDP